MSGIWQKIMTPSDNN